MFDKTGNVSLVLSFDKKDFIEYRTLHAPRLSISGVQDKISLKLVKGHLEPTDTGGEYILKPVPGLEGVKRKEDIPANEHFTMTMARHFNISSASCALVHFSNGEPAYLVKRFDRKPDGMKILQEDFCQLSNRSEESHGKNYKYDGTYEEMGELLQKFCPAYRVEVVKLFRLLVYIYLTGNGDAHLKNFSLIESGHGDHVLSPSYDLMNSSIHFPEESRTALDLFREYESEHFRRNGFYTGYDFMKLGEMYGIPGKVIADVLQVYSGSSESFIITLDQSFMSNEGKAVYKELYRDRVRALGIGV